jgi:hypothetical protein
MFVSEVEERAGSVRITVREAGESGARAVLFLACVPGPAGQAAFGEAVRLLREGALLESELVDSA